MAHKDVPAGAYSYYGLILTFQDALLLLEGARRKLVPTVKKRLNDAERKLIRDGSVYAWSEAECGMKRWTDGRSWLALKIKGPFLTYREHDKSGNLMPHGLTKQIFSLTTQQDGKLHLVAYYDLRKRELGEITGSRPSLDEKLVGLLLDPAIYTNESPQKPSPLAPQQKLHYNPYPEVWLAPPMYQMSLPMYAPIAPHSYGVPPHVPKTHLPNIYVPPRDPYPPQPVPYSRAELYSV